MVYPIQINLCYPKRDLNFQQALINRVNQYFIEHNTKNRQLIYYIQTFFSLLVIYFSYYALVFTHLSISYKIAAIIFLIVGLTSYAVNVMHNANHSAYSQHKIINRALGYIFDMCGISSYLWRIEHNQQHHRYTNITGLDPDLDHSWLLRVSPDQACAWFHRYQAYYIWFLYSLMVVRWHIWGDYTALWVLHKNKSKLFPTKKQLAVLFSGKMIFYFFAFIIPLMFYPLITVIGCYLFICMSVSMIIAPLFDVAHINDKVEILKSEQVVNHRMEYEYFIHQMKTTSNFSSNNRFLSFGIGGLNFQIEHHLFPYVSHIHYPEISKIIKYTCEEFHIVYHEFNSFWDALKSHHRWLKTLGTLKV